MLTKQEINKQLKGCGHSNKRIKEIHKEAKNSSNPEYIYNYWGVKN